MNDVINGGPADARNTNFMIRSQNDLYMVVNNYGAEINSHDDNTIVSLENGTVTRGELQRSAMNICKFIMNALVFTREQQFIETYDSLKANASLSVAEAQHLAVDAQIKPLVDGSVYMNVAESGLYRIIVHIMSPHVNTAQSACNVWLNEQLATTIQTNGTDGKWIKQKLVKVELEAGQYELKLEFTKPGMVIEWIQFKKI